MGLLLLFGVDGAPVFGQPPPPTEAPNQNCVLTIQDAFGNPLPPRTLASILNASDLPGTAPLTQGYLGLGSTITASNLTIGNAYRVEYDGAAAPIIPTFFVAEPTVLVVPDYYVSPFATTDGYGQIAGWNIPLGRTSRAALLPGGGFRVILESVAAVFGQMDTFARTVSAGQRLVSCTQGQIATWVTDFLGDILPSFPGESDAAYIARIEAWLQQAFTTIPALQAVVNGFLKANPEPIINGLVFDRQSDPARAAYYGLTAGQFAIVLYAAVGNVDGWFLGQRFIGQDTFVAGTTTNAGFTLSLTSPFPLLQEQIEAVKAAGSVPVYISSTGGL
jgi:hypothetical protein